MSQQRTSAAQNAWFNKTVDFNQGSALNNSIENESLTQDSLFDNRNDYTSGGNTFRAMLAKTPGYIGTTNSSQFKTMQPEDINIRDSNLMDPKFNS